MPDITMCKGEGCKIRETCYRYRAKPNPHWQSYFMKAPCAPDGKTCERYSHYEDVQPSRLKRRVRP